MLASELHDLGNVGCYRNLYPDDAKDLKHDRSLRVHHVLLLGHYYRSQELGLLTLRDTEVVARLSDLTSRLVELLRGEVKVLVRFIKWLSCVPKGSTSCLQTRELLR
jgi:hypothetical protein